jgi:hypothetical protein
MHVTAKRIDRALEWFLAGFSLFWGVSAHVPLSGARLEAACAAPPPPFSAIVWTLTAAALGMAHMAALMINGTMSWTPLLRLVVTSLNAGFFAMVASVLALSGGCESGLTYGYITIGFVWCAYVAGQDMARMRLGTYGL